jgi:hypothetical protein
MAGATAARLRLRISLLALLLPAPLYAQSAAEADLKAALVFNFAQYTEWEAGAPGAALPSFTICYAGAEMAEAFAQVATRQMRGREILPRPVAAEGPYAGCQVVYWTEGNVRRAVPGKAGPGVLTIGSGDGFLARGGIIESHIENARMVFSINQEAARVAGLRFSSKLLRLAKNLTDRAQ